MEDVSEEKRSLIRQPLHTLGGIIAEACRIYRQMRDGKLEHQEGRSLVWCLGQMRAMVETAALERLEQRLEELAPGIESKAMASRQQIARLAQRIEALEVSKQGTRTAWVWRHTNETEAEALARHYRDRPDDRAASKTYIVQWRNHGRGRGA